MNDEKGCPEVMYDVLAVDIKTNKVRFIAQSKNAKNANAIVSMAVTRRGVDEEFFADVVAGTYKDGDEWRG